MTYIRRLIEFFVKIFLVSYRVFQVDLALALPTGILLRETDREIPNWNFSVFSIRVSAYAPHSRVAYFNFETKIIVRQ